MSITPQAIKDQEFQVKFRGYDTVEVKAYLELIADEFFEILEKKRVKTEEVASLEKERQELQGQHDDLAATLEEIKNASDNAKKQQQEQEQLTAELRREVDRLRQEVATLEGEQERQQQQVTEAEQELRASGEKLQQQKQEREALQRRFDSLEQENLRFKQEEVDLKSTLVAAQKFTDDIKEKSEEEAQRIVEAARLEAEQIKEAYEQELAAVPQEIAALKEQRSKVRDELEEVLMNHLEALDSFGPGDKSAAEDEYGELFQSVQVAEDGTVDPDDLDKISMDLGLPASAETVKA